VVADRSRLNDVRTRAFGRLREGSLSRDGVYSLLSHAAAPLVTFLATPYLLHHLGTEKYGLWALLSTALMVATTLDGGLGQAATRFVAVRRSAHDRAATARLIGSAVLWITLLGVAVDLVVLVVAQPAVDTLVSDPRLRPDAIDLAHFLAPLTVLYLLGAVLVSVLQGHQRFLATAVVAVAAQGAFVGVVVALLPSEGLHGLLLAVGAEEAVVVLTAAAAVMKHMDLRAPHFLPWTDLKQIGGYGWRMQIATVSLLVNSALDLYVCAAFSSIRVVAIVSIGISVAAAIRYVPMWLLPPLYSRLAYDWGRGSESAVRAEVERMSRTVQLWAFGYTAIAAVSAPFVVVIWLGTPFRESGLIASVLIVGAGFNLAVTTICSYGLSAVGSPGIAAKAAAASALVNVVLTIPAAVWAGPFGIVTATSIAAVFGALYLLYLTRRSACPWLAPKVSAPPVVGTLLATGVAAGLGWLVLDLPGRGTAWLPFACVPPVAAFGVYAVSLRSSGASSPLRSSASAPAVVGEVT
jgi:O-antigen/teichoic acid export membrane protein